MRILLTTEYDQVYSSANMYSFAHEINNCKLNDIKLNMHVVDMNMNININREREIDFKNFYQKRWGITFTNIPFRFIDLMNDIKPYYFRIIMSIGLDGNYILSDRYPLYSILTIKKFNINICPFYVGYLCYKNKINVLKYLGNKKLESIKDCMQKDHTIISIASICGNINVLEWWKNFGLELKYTEFALDGASENNLINVLEWWKNSGLELKYSEDALYVATYRGNIGVLEWWKKSGLPLKYDRDVILDMAKENKNVDVLTWWKNSGLLT